MKTTSIYNIEVKPRLYVVHLLEPHMMQFSHKDRKTDSLTVLAFLLKIHFSFGFPNPFLPF